MRKREKYSSSLGLPLRGGVVHTNIGFSIATGMFNRPHYLESHLERRLTVGWRCRLSVASLVVVTGEAPRAVLPLADPGKIQRLDPCPGFARGRLPLRWRHVRGMGVPTRPGITGSSAIDP